MPSTRVHYVSHALLRESLCFVCRILNVYAWNEALLCMTDFDPFKLSAVVTSHAMPVWAFSPGIPTGDPSGASGLILERYASSDNLVYI